NGGTDTITVNVTIDAVNDAPTASNSSFTTNEDTPYSGTLTANDPDSDPLTYSIVTDGTKGTAVITNASTGAFTYTPATGQNGSDWFSFKVNDGSVDSNIAIVTVTIIAGNDAPTASNSSITTDEGTPYSGTLTASDPESDPLNYSIVTDGTKGTACLSKRSLPRS
ncbi:MAG: Ig-like domain-containing protein, partial [Bacteroidales bacterium]